MNPHEFCLYGMTDWFKIGPSIKQIDRNLSSIESTFEQNGEAHAYYCLDFSAV